MFTLFKVCLLTAVAGAATLLCPICERGLPEAHARQASAVPSSDTATVRLHISKMTCGTCAPAARLALKKVGGVYDAKVTYSDSLAVVRYDPARVTPREIAEQLTKLTGYPAAILPDSAATRSSPPR